MIIRTAKVIIDALSKEATSHNLNLRAFLYLLLNRTPYTTHPYIERF